MFTGIHNALKINEDLEEVTTYCKLMEKEKKSSFPIFFLNLTG